uniref:armadillo repeat-containing protein 3-like n=1 Tax=Oncorhynchus gorbuscha TaxID=8017 RepID=UPI001EAEBAD1|nr:armadillo repeat-containing protein 3-like [Oncorhynchus gorbuscha]
MDNNTQVTFREKQGFDRLLEFLCNKLFSDLHVAALQVVSIWLEDRDRLQLIHETGGLQRLLQFITTPNLLDIQTHVVKAISRVQSPGCHCSLWTHTPLSEPCRPSRLACDAEEQADMSVSLSVVWVSNLGQITQEFDVSRYDGTNEIFPKVQTPSSHSIS